MYICETWIRVMVMADWELKVMVGNVSGGWVLFWSLYNMDYGIWRLLFLIVIFTCYPGFSDWNGTN